MRVADSLFDLVEGDDGDRLCRDISESQCREEPLNLVRLTIAQIGGKGGDVLADPKVVMPWLMGVVGAPAFLTSMIVPIREALALLPQVLVGAAIRRFAVRKWFWIAASIVEGLAVLGMAAVGAFGIQGAIAGWAIICLVILFSAARGVASVAWKDTLGKTAAKGRRGKVGGYASSVAGAIAAMVGLYLGLAPDTARPEWLLYVLLAAASTSWVLGALTLATLKEYPGATDGGRSLSDIARDQMAVILGDKELQKFLIVRALMTSTALSSPIYVSLAQAAGGGALANLGWLMLATGAASALSSAFWGIWADRSSRAVMALGAGISGTLGFGMLAGLRFAPELMEGVWPFGVALFVLSVGHAGVRIGRKTHIVDIAEGDSKSEYVAVSNTIIGVALLGIGAVIAGLAMISLQAALMALSAMALAGAAGAAMLKSAQAE